MRTSTCPSKLLFVHEIAHQVREALADEKFRKRTNEVVIEAMEEQWTLLNNERESNATLHRKHMAWHEGGCEGEMPPRPKVNRGAAHTLDDWPFPVEHGVDESPGCILLLAAINDFAADNPDQFRKKDCEFESLELNIAVFSEKENEEEELSEEEEALASWAHYGFSWVMAVSKLTTEHESRLRQAIARALVEIGAKENVLDERLNLQSNAAGMNVETSSQKTGKVKMSVKRTINERMRKVLDEAKKKDLSESDKKHPGNWSAQLWADILECAKSSISETLAWKDIMRVRGMGEKSRQEGTPRDP